MTADQMRIAVAESLGWRLARDEKYPADKNYWLWNPQGQPVSGDVECGWQFHLTKLPNFPADLNAIQEAALTLGWIHGGTYAVELRKIVRRDQKPEMFNPDTDMLCDLYFYEATAAQRCEAYLKVKHLWKEDAK